MAKHRHIMRFSRVIFVKLYQIDGCQLFFADSLPKARLQLHSQILLEYLLCRMAVDEVATVHGVRNISYKFFKLFYDNPNRNANFCKHCIGTWSLVSRGCWTSCRCNVRLSNFLRKTLRWTWISTVTVVSFKMNVIHGKSCKNLDEVHQAERKQDLRGRTHLLS